MACAASYRLLVRRLPYGPVETLVRTLLESIGRRNMHVIYSGLYRLLYIYVYVPFTDIDLFLYINH